MGGLFFDDLDAAAVPYDAEQVGIACVWVGGWVG